jgi:thioredoxin reductase
MFVENIIVGAGPSSLQLAYYFMKNNISYIVVEKENSCASFFKKYPHSKKLISLNKKYTGRNDKDFNLRHDWNSLLNDENFLFTEYTDELYPNSEFLYNYLNDFSKKFQLNIKFNTKIIQIDKENNKYILKLDNDEIISCNKLIIGTGNSKPSYPKMVENINKDEKIIKHYADYPNNYFLHKDTVEKYKNKKVLIIGGGNSAYELANLLQSYCSNIIILGTKKKLSIVSHYVGDIRSIYLPFLDTFYLKSLNGIDNGIKEHLEESEIIKNETTQLYRLIKHQKNYYEGNSDIEEFHEIILCTGWKFDDSIFNFNIKMSNNNKYPELNYKYESSNNKNLFFIGSLMHSKDFKKGSGGFIHGFRYLIKLFSQMEYKIPLSIKKIQFTGNMECYNKLTEHIYNRINNSSSLYQLYGTMCDLFYFDKNDDENIIYIEDIKLDYIEHLKLENKENLNVLMLEYGEEVTEINKLGGFNKFNPNFLHPRIYIFNKKMHEKILINGKINNQILIDRIIFEEDLTANFRNKKYIDKINRILKTCNLII